MGWQVTLTRRETAALHFATLMQMQGYEEGVVEAHIFKMADKFLAMCERQASKDKERAECREKSA